MANKESGTKLFNSRYVIDKLINTGGMHSEVYQIRDPNKPGQKLIAKVIYYVEEKDNDGNVTSSVDSFYKTYKNESITSRRLLNKPNLVQTYDFIHNEDKTEVALIQEYVDGVGLKDYIDLKGFLTPRIALYIFKQVLIGVRGLHKFDHQIIHCDLKPENIVIAKDLSKVTIIDFGIASVLRKDETNNINEMLTSCGPHGTECYMAPDWIQDKITVQYDFFALGVILYQMITNDFPFKKAVFTDGKTTHTDQEDSDRTVKTIRKPLKYDMPNISSNPAIPVAIENLIFRCIASKPEDIHYRFNDIDELIAETDRVIELVDSNKDDKQLIKPVDKRSIEIPDLIVSSKLEENNKWYQKWWFAALVAGATATILIIAIVVFFIIK